MADQQKGAAPKAPAPYPKNWGKMNAQQKHDWMKANRPAYNAPEPAKPAAKPAAKPPVPVPAPAPAPGGAQSPAAEGRSLVQVEVTQYTVTVGTREPVECSPENLTAVIASEMDAWAEENRPEDGPPLNDERGDPVGS